MAGFAVAAAWAVLTPNWMYRSTNSTDLVAEDSKVVLSLEAVKYRYDFIPKEQSKGLCPSVSCPLSPDVPSAHLTRLRAPLGNALSLTTLDGWHKTMYMRWDVKAPSFVRSKGDLVAFDFYGIHGASWKFFVNGQKVSSGSGSSRRPAVVFSSPVTSGEALTFGFEIDAGKSLMPGIASVAQPFLSEPSVAEQLRQSYRAMDQVYIFPMATAYTLIAILAAFGCFFTPFYREILAFSIFVTLSNWRRLIINDMSAYPEFSEIDFVVFDCMLRSAIYASLWAFWALYFRVKSKWAYIPVVFYAAAVPGFYLLGEVDIYPLLFLQNARNADLHLALVFLGGSVFAFSTLRETRSMPWARFRHTVLWTLGFANLILCGTLFFRYQLLTNNVAQETIIAYALFLNLAKLSMQSFIILMGMTIFLEWALIVRDRQQVLQRFGTVVDPRFMNEIIRGPERQSRRIEQAVILFADLRSFAKMCDLYAPDLVTMALNDYLDVVTRAVTKHGGVVDKFVGDSVMALWGVPERRVNDEVSAVRAAIDIRAGLCELNEKRAESCLFRLEAGVGVHCGPAIFGAVGNGQRVDYTVIGSTINVAARIQSLTKRFLFDVVISSQLQAIVKDYTLVENVGEVRIRGVAVAVGLVKLIGVSMVDGEFVIGRQDLEAAVPNKAAGIMSGVPSTLSVPEIPEATPIVELDSDKAA